MLSSSDSTTETSFASGISESPSPPAQMGGANLLTATGAAMMFVISMAVAGTVQGGDWSSPSPPPQEELRVDQETLLAAEVMSFANLKPGWDGEQGETPSEKAVDEALQFLELLPSDAPLPTPSVAGDGEVGFYWRTLESYIDVSFYGDGQIYLYASGATDIEPRAEEYSGRSIPRDLAAAIASIG